MATTKQRPKVAFKTNVPVELKFQDSPETAKLIPHKQFGDSFLYTVFTDDGTEKALFATKLLHETLQDAELVKGDVVAITKAEVEGSKSITWEIDPIENAPAPATPAAADQDPDSPAPPFPNLDDNGLPGWRKKEISIHTQVAIKEAVRIQAAQINAGYNEGLNEDQLARDTNTIYSVMVRAYNKFEGEATG